MLTKVLVSPWMSRRQRFCTNLPQDGRQFHRLSLKNVPSFPYLGSVLSVKADIDAEIVNRLRAASSAFGKLRERVFESRGLSKDTKILVYKAVVLPALHYGSECWTTYRRHLKCLEKYHPAINVVYVASWEWPGRTIVQTAAYLTKPTVPEAMVITNQLRWTGHIIRLDESRLPQHILHGELGTGTRSQGGPLEDRESVSRTI